MGFTAPFAFEVFFHINQFAHLMISFKQMMGRDVETGMAFGTRHDHHVPCRQSVDPDFKLEAERDGFV